MLQSYKESSDRCSEKTFLIVLQTYLVEFPESETFL